MRQSLKGCLLPSKHDSTPLLALPPVSVRGRGWKQRKRLMKPAKASSWKTGLHWQAKDCMVFQATLCCKTDPCRSRGEVLCGWHQLNWVVPKLFVARRGCLAKPGNGATGTIQKPLSAPLSFWMTLMAAVDCGWVSCSCSDVCLTCGSCPGTDRLCPSQSIRLSFCPHAQRPSVICHQLSILRRGRCTWHTSVLMTSQFPFRPEPVRPIWWRKHVSVFSSSSKANSSLSFLSFSPYPLNYTHLLTKHLTTAQHRVNKATQQ